MGTIRDILHVRKHGYSSKGLISKCCNSSVYFIGGNEGDFLAIPTTICDQCRKECSVSGPTDHTWMRRLEDLKKIAKKLRKGRKPNLSSSKQ